MNNNNGAPEKTDDEYYNRCYRVSECMGNIIMILTRLSLCMGHVSTDVLGLGLIIAF